MKKEETNDIVQYLIPQLETLGISRDNCKVDVTTEKSGQSRGDVWVSLKKQNERKFEENIIALIEAKHKKAIIGDMDWRDAMRQGKEKATKQGLHYYIVTNCTDEFRFYNAHNDEEILLDGKALTKLVTIEVLQKIQSQVSIHNSYVLHRASEVTRPFSEDKFRVTLRVLADIYRSAGLKKGDERIDPTVSFVVLKYISENEKDKRTLNEVIKLWDDLRKIAKDEEVGDLKAEFDKTVQQIWGKDSEYKDNIYEDFKDLISISQKLKNEHCKKIYNELNEYPFHGVNFDLFGAIYEEFASQTKKKEFGEYYTRRHITKMVAMLLLRNETNPRVLKICDPACGTGGFLTEAYKALETLYSQNGKLNKSVATDLRETIFWGYDNDDKSVARTKLNMFLVGDGHVHIYENDSLIGENKKKGWVDNEFDYIMTNPPMGQYDGEAKIEDFKFTNERRYELLFIEKVIEATKSGGEIAIVINDGALETPSRENFRKKLLEACDIYTIISLTKFAFAPYTKEKTYILFMQKKQEDEMGEIQKIPIWHFILDYDGYANSDKRYKTKYHDDLPDLEEKFDGAIRLAKIYLSDKARFEREKSNFERKINDREQKEGLWGMKYGYVEMEKVTDENFHNLLSEFHLRPIIKTKITKKDFDKNISMSLKQIYELKESNSLHFPNILDKQTEASAILGDILYFKGGNSGLTEEFIYNNQPNTEDEKIPIFSGATVQNNSMGLISEKACPNGKKLKIFHEPAILVVRKGKAGNMVYLERGRYTTNDDIYVLTPKKEWKDKINLRWFTYQYQELFYNLVTSKSDNATFNKDYAEKQRIVLPDKNTQDRIAEVLLKIDGLLETLDTSNIQIKKLMEQEIIS
ncbi:MAG: N-6 DNA methylase [Candidatus Methanoperedens sp.]|nr:N-6 DNA methylase [Candidatus Methanoperedens sp.]